MCSRTPPSDTLDATWKRYSDFANLYKALETSARGRITIPDFHKFAPEYKVRGVKGEVRLQQLEKWTNELTKLPGINYNHHYLGFFGILMATTATAAVANQESDDVAPSTDDSELRPTMSAFAKNPALADTFDAVLSLGLEVDKRRDVTVCQSISVLVSAFFATLEGIATQQKYHDRKDVFSSQCVASAKLLEAVGFCVCVESLLSCGDFKGGGKVAGELTKQLKEENTMLEDLDDAVKQLERVTLVCELAGDGEPNECTAITPSSSTGDDGLEFDVHVKLTQACYAVKMFHRAGTADLPDGADPNVKETPTFHRASVATEPEPEPKLEQSPDTPVERGRCSTALRPPKGEPSCFQLLEDDARQAVIKLVEDSLPTNAEGIQRLRLALLEHGLDDDDEDQVTEVIRFYTEQSSEPPSPVPESTVRALPQPPVVQYRQQQEPPLFKPGPVRVPVRAMLFTQGVNEWQSTANAARRGGLQDEINRESRQRMTDLVEQLKRHPDQAGAFDLDAREEELKQLYRVLNDTLDASTKNLNVLTRASALARGLGCARVTHCKSGKDRTSMSVTLEQVRVCLDTSP